MTRSDPEAHAGAGPSAADPAAGAGAAQAQPRARILFVDGGRLPRAALVVPVAHHFDIREVGDGESAWQAVLLDSSIRVLVFDFSSPAMRGLDLLARLRGSRVQRIRELPVVALANGPIGLDPQKMSAMEVTELQMRDQPAPEAIQDLVLRLRMLAELAATRDALSESRTELETARSVDPETDLLTASAFDMHVEKLLSHGRRALSDIAMICLRVEIALPESQASSGQSEQRMQAVSRALGAAIRLEDLATRSDKDELCVATANDGMTDMLRFAARLRKILENSDAAGPGVEVWTFLGVATHGEEMRRNAVDLRRIAQRRARAAQASRSRRIMLGAEGGQAQGTDGRVAGGSMDIGLALVLIASGRGAEVVPHLPFLLQQLNPLLRLIRQQQLTARQDQDPERTS